ncbi:ribonuclease H [Chitinophaga silvatica]|uniref:Ribonuclease H n=1 Tax=Chitinophaga silvatica TaxID=2282649 RepID=A0A3E1YFY7_9BACT|nr:ribonuclease H family protein [Chitinophaga silvatica]RFS26294.1 ribonuclease H [Chitinophaga silvatica]
MPKFYVVWNGRKTGVFNTWEECEAQISGFPNGKFKAYPTLAAANDAFVNGNTPTHIPYIAESISVDAAWNTETKDMEFRAVKTADKSQIFHRGPFKDGTVNIGEFLAIVLALEYCRVKGLNNLPIYSDSTTAMKWVNDKQPNSYVTPTKENEELLKILELATSLLNSHTYTNPILKWNTQEWGENPADFGRK